MAINLAEFKKQLDRVGIHVAYRLFPPGKTFALPCIVYYEDSVVSFIADNKRYFAISNMTVELYTNKKDVALEEKLESVISEKYVFTKTETFVDTEKMLLIYYELEEI